MVPDNEVAGTVDRVVTRNDDSAVTLRSIRPYSSGIVLGLVLHRRSEPDLKAGTLPFRLVDEEVLLGVELSHGTTATSASGPLVWDPEPTDARTPFLCRVSGGGGGREHKMACLLTPLPAPGELVVVPAKALAEPIGRGRVLWSRQPDHRATCELRRRRGAGRRLARALGSP